jgi:uncharacterized OsmC-like protein
MTRRIRVLRDGGDRYTIGIGAHEVVVDQPVEDGGTDTGPSPTELFVASIASCTAHYAGRFLGRHGIDANGLEVTAEFAIGDRPGRVVDLDLRLVVPALPEDAKDRLRAVVEHCTVKNSIAKPAAIRLQISRAADGGNIEAVAGVESSAQLEER